MTIQVGFHAEDKTIEEIIFGPKKFKIPRYQRPYSWGEDQVADFWNDIKQQNTASFLGSFVFNLEYLKKEGYIEIIDGQQRVLTITIFMCVIRDILNNIGEEKSATRVQTQCIAFEDKRGRHTFKVDCGETLDRFFKKHIQQENPEPFPQKATKEEKLVIKNYEYLKNEIQGELEQIPEKMKKVNYLLDLWDIISYLKVIWIEIANDDQAYEIFETVNARGAELTVADLLKNLIFKNVKFNEKGVDIAQAKWQKIESNIADAGVDLSKFIRHHWLSKYSFVGEKALFKGIKHEIADFSCFLDELVDASEIYKKLSCGKKDDWREIDGGIKIYNSLLGVRAAGASQCYTLFLSLLRNRHLIGMNPITYFRHIEKFTFLYSGVCKLQTNKVEKLYSKTAIAIESHCKSPEKKHILKNIQRELGFLVDSLKELKPSQAIFDDSFADITYKTSERSRVFIKYILSTINKYVGGSEIDLDFDEVSIEHILPQRPCAEWGLKKADIKDYVDLLGNLTLVDRKYNSEAGNKSAKDKIKILLKSQIAITKGVASEIRDNSFEWNKGSIVKRQKDLAEIAYEKVWAF